MVNLRVIKKNKNKYYYLEHTVRRGDRFENKRIYLGKELPKDLNDLKDQFNLQIIEETHKTRLEKIKRSFNKEFSLYPGSYKEKYVESFMIKFTYNTNRIEGGTLSLKETSDLLEEHITPKNKPVKDVKEAESHKKVFYEMMGYERDLLLATVLHWHKELFKDIDDEIAGIIRKHPVAIARSKTELPLPVELDMRLHDFFLWYNKNKNKMNPVILAALVHLKFVTIHPFSDGNGRISRLMMNFVLHKNKYPMLNIDYTNRNAYYTALERSQTNEKDNIFVNYIVKKYMKSYSEFVKDNGEAK